MAACANVYLLPTGWQQTNKNYKNFCWGNFLYDLEQQHCSCANKFFSFWSYGNDWQTAADWEVRSVTETNQRHSYKLCHKMSSSVVLQPTVSLWFHEWLWKASARASDLQATQWDSQFYVMFGSPVYLVWFIVRVTLEQKCVCLNILRVLQQISMNLTYVPALV